MLDALAREQLSHFSGLWVSYLPLSQVQQQEFASVVALSSAYINQNYLYAGSHAISIYIPYTVVGVRTTVLQLYWYFRGTSSSTVRLLQR